MLFSFTPAGYLVLGGILIGVSLLGLVQRQRPAAWLSRAMSLVVLAVGVILIIVQTQPPATPSGQFRGTVKEVVNGDVMCYVTLAGETGRFTVGASFEVCEPRWVGQEVDFVVAPGRVNACESAEPCGQTQDLLLIVGMSKVR